MIHATRSRRGELYRVARPPARDPKRFRVFVVVSRQALIDSRFSTIICAPVYSTRHGLATQVDVGLNGGLRHDSSVHCDELVSLRKSQLTQFVGTFDTTKLKCLDDALMVALGLLRKIVAVEVTPIRVHDCRLLPALLDQIPGRIVQVSGDGAYDTRACYQSILEREAVATIPPRRSARLSESVDPPAWRAMRDAYLREIRRLGRYEWRLSSGCTRQSLAENAMSRFKTLFGPKLSARRFDNQRVEAIIKCEVLNRMSSRGMPESVRIR